MGECRRPGRVILNKDIDAADILALRRKGAEDIPVHLAGTAGENAVCSEARAGDRLFRMVSQVQMKQAQASFAGERRQSPVSARLVLRVGEPARLTVFQDSRSVEAMGAVVEKANARGADRERVVAQLEKTGGTPYIIDRLDMDLDENAFCPASLLNGLRRDALAALDAARTAVNREDHPMIMPVLPERGRERTVLMAQSGSMEVLRRALESGADQAVFAPEDVRPEALDRIDPGSLTEGRGPIALAVPAVLSGASLNTLNAWARRHGDKIGMTFISNVGQLALKWPGRLAADFLMNVGNNLSLAQLEQWNVDLYTPSVELNAGQIARLCGKKCLILWGRIPLMHLRHCPLRAGTGAKGLHRDCRRCDSGASEGLGGRALKDRKGVDFPLARIATQDGCVIQVLNSAELMPLRRQEKLPEAAAWRLLLREDEPVEAVTRLYRVALDGGDFRRMPEWQAIENMNTTTGHYFRGVE